MKVVSILLLFLLSSTFMFGQEVAPQNPKKVAPTDTIVPGKETREKQIEKIDSVKVKKLSDSTGNEPAKSALVDTTKQNKYGDLLEDDTTYNKRYPIWIPITEVVGTNAFIWALDRYILNADYARIGIQSWKNNIVYGWEWDNDRFGVNFIGHPYSGTLSYNAGRANGYNFYQSFCFAVGGSLLWEYFGENTRPSYNDIIYTPVNGTFFGEILYRLSSNILDDRTRGVQRVFREIAAGLIDPMRGFNRLIQGKSFRRTNKEVYEKEPINISLYAGLRKINEIPYDVFGKGTYSGMINLQFDYGNPFELRKRKPFDFFKLRVDLNFGVGRKYLDNILGYGILFGRNAQLGKIALLIGGYQYYDYWDNNKFELGTIAFGGGIISKLALSKTSNLYTSIHLALVPFGGNSTKFVIDTTQVRDYNFVGGLEAKFESTFNLGKYATATLRYYFYWMRTYIGKNGNNFIHILKPRITVRLYKNMSIGCEAQLYYNDLYQRGLPAVHAIQTEQKIFLLFFLEDKQRRGYYN
ncbi:MAG: DUF3943 domain-containing protein [Bacteroidales bacterium]|jgi:hypothetical protein|nr:DUF3943 domain-containing protein [Bacteroidales bacterium]